MVLLIKKCLREFFFKERDINDELVRKYHLVLNLKSLLKNFKKSRNDSEKDKVQVNLIKNVFNNLKN